jgi:hypothetical protein
MIVAVIDKVNNKLIRTCCAAKYSVDAPDIVCMYVNMHACAYMCMPLVCVCACMHIIYIYIYIYICVCVCVYIYIYIFIYIYVCVCVYIYIYTHTIHHSACDPKASVIWVPCV